MDDQRGGIVGGRAAGAAVGGEADQRAFGDVCSTLGIQQDLEEDICKFTASHLTGIAEHRPYGVFMKSPTLHREHSCALASAAS